MRKYFLPCSILPAIILLCITSTAFAQVIQTNVKPNATVNMERLNRIDELVNSYINKNWLTGAVTIVIKDNQLVQYKGYGLADVDTKKPMAKDAIFRIMSQTKAITSAGILILYEQGKFLLDENGNLMYYFPSNIEPLSNDLVSKL